MIAHVEGRVATVRLDAVVVSVGGVGLLVHTTPDTLSGVRPGEVVCLSTSLVVREESLTLYGFADDDARDTFETLQTVSGVGPRLALAVLAVHAPPALRAAVAAGDAEALTRVPGIGKKGAQRMLLELADRLVGTLPDTPAPVAGAAVVPAPTPVPVGTVGSQVVVALTGLGWSARQAEEAVTAVTAANGGVDGAATASAAPAGPDGGAPDASAVLRAALRHLGRS